MTDKEIITDGIDVSECHNYNSKNGKCPIPYWIGYIKCTGLNCSDIKDCYFKQLKHQEQKNENLNKVTIAQRKENTELTIKLGEMINRGGELYGELQKYKQALERLRDIVKKFLRTSFIIRKVRLSRQKKSIILLKK